MKKNTLILSLLTLFSVFSVSAEDSFVLTVNNEKVPLSYFQYIYQKSEAASSEQKSVQDYLPSFIDFKLKVAEAKSLGLDTLQSFKSELDGYRKQLIGPYLIDEKEKETLLKEEYSRSLEDVDVSHILIKIKDTQSPADTLLAYQKAQSTIARLRTAPFDSVAVWMSDDVSVKTNYGHIGFISAMWMVYPFETAAYNTPVGKISKIVRSDFGYHIIKVNARRKSLGKVLVAHIMTLTNDTVKGQNEQAEKKINDIYQQLQSGADFETLAKSSSEDPSTSAEGGKMPWFGTGRIVKSFEDVAFSLKNKGEISAPFKTPFGWHIVKLLDKKESESFDEAKEELERSLMRSDRAKLLKQRFISKLKTEYSYTENTKTKQKIEKMASSAQYVDSLFFIEAQKAGKQVILSFAGNTRSVSQFCDFMKQKRLQSSNIYKALDLYAAQELLAYEDSQLESKYADLKNLMQEYSDGILLFDVSKKEVWDEASNDTIGLRRIFEQNKAAYKWESEGRFKGRVVFCKDKATEKVVRKIFASVSNNDSIDAQLKALNKDKDVVVRSERGLYAKGTNKTVDALLYKDGQLVLPKGFSVAFLEGKTIFEPETYLDTRGQVIQEYQSQKEQEWIQQLRSKYLVEINEEVLKTLNKN